ncbi:hypothetical protein MYX82_07965 [Acidobacteria bacterium AH-259-D05]|nr:hypothetical protein [Acidobacteria bacterium AH-259-D05]
MSPGLAKREKLPPGLQRQLQKNGTLPPGLQKRFQDRAFGKDQEKIIRNWFLDKKNLDGLPPGLAKREQLPPGLQRQLQPVPEALKHSLPKLPTGLKRGIIGGDLVLVEEGSEEILDIITNVFSAVGQVF